MLKLQSINKKIGSFKVRDINFEVNDGEYFVVLGKSGAGKSVLLELVSGLLIPDKGNIYIDDTDVTYSKIQKRNVGLVFQNHSLFPHISVRANIAYPLKAGKLKDKNITERVVNTAEILGIEHLLERYPETLSLGEAQRTALARTLITEPKCLLLDEPLSSLDSLTKSEIRRLLRNINRGGIFAHSKDRGELKQTIVHVTHDYEEALALADRVAVFEDGGITQIGTPKSVFKQPKSGFIAKFVGIKNFFRGELQKDGSYSSKFIIDNFKTVFYSSETGFQGSGCLIIKSEDITISKTFTDSSARNNFEGIVADIEQRETGFEVTVDINGLELSALITELSLKKLNLKINEKAFVSFKANAVKFIKN